ncbi:hypothetical protein IQ255_27960, partial [Pleurocapsales cyanobacterium LEGE 10410]|nr:hypothetical protein [Pleurocapsales cyanobacterium LEGE 10410]
MSHTIGQAKQEDQQSNSNSSQADRDTPKPDKTAPGSLSDADYEFLFNQLLEGIAHGWHDRRIAKFFNQLGDRGKPSDWVAWLERLQDKIIILPTQSKGQLGTMMIRFGELTQATAEIKLIGAASRRIGRELLFDNTKDLIWEYVGSDLPSASLQAEASTAQLSTNFASPATIEPESVIESESTAQTLEQVDIATSTELNPTIEQQPEQVSDSSTIAEIPPREEPSLPNENNLLSETPDEKITISFLSNSDSNS